MRYIVLHGHFYQPPRENPWTERVEKEPSAHPFHDWNARVHRESYAPHRAARILEDGKITAITNNYRGISFDFGPTLLDWMVNADPETVEAIVRADRESRARLGHGNAMAQAHHHAILPLLPRRQKRTEVQWGLAHFRRTFGRPAEGMWLPEAATDLETLDVLAEAGVRFTVLSPGQLAEWRTDPEHPWRKPGADDLGRAYRVRTSPSREIAVFFYDGALARGIAFGDLLRSGAELASTLRNAARALPDDAPLLHAATDGETYGHHHRFGEMALAFALRDVSAGRDPITLTNYAAFLAAHPATHEALITEPGSWSCAHGIERWRSDCGCMTGGTPGASQTWRVPLFQAVSTLRETLDRVMEAEGAKLFRDPWAARDAYIEVLLEPSREHREAFLARHSRRPEQRLRTWRLLEMQRHALLMFTSCGWFFHDLAGLETLQILRYAMRAIELAGPDLPPGAAESFLETLRGARANGDPARTGEDLVRQIARTSRAGADVVAAEAVLVKRFGLGQTYPSFPPAYRAVVEPNPSSDTGRVTVTQVRTEDVHAYRYRAEVDERPRVEVHLEPTTTEPPVSALPWETMRPSSGPRRVGAEDLLPESAQIILDRFLERLERNTVSRLKGILRARDPVLRFLESRGIAPPQSLGRILEAVWHDDLLQELASPLGSSESANRWSDRLTQFASLGLVRNDERIGRALVQRMLARARLLADGGENETRALLDLLDAAEVLSPRPDLWDVQNLFYETVTSRGPSAETIPRWQELASRLGFHPGVVERTR